MIGAEGISLVSAGSPESQRDEALIAIWTKVIDVQMHFNDLCVRLRTAAIAVLGVLFGAAGISYKYGGSVMLFGAPMHIASAFLIIALGCLCAFGFMDRFWYHALLRGSVAHGEAIESELKRRLLVPGLSTTVKEYSQRSLKITAGAKLVVFYVVLASVIVAALYASLGDGALESCPKQP